MVLGIGSGKLEIILNKNNYLPGEKIAGKVILELNKPIKAKELRILFYGEYRTGGRKNRIRRIYEVFDRLDTEKEYPQGIKTYEFSLTIPQIKRAEHSGEGIVNSVLKFVTESFDPIKQARWYVDANLDMPMAFDVRKKLQISLQI